MDINSREHTFARDFVFCVMSKWREEWKPEGVYNVKSVNSPFSPAMREKVLSLVEENRDVIQKKFENYFPDAIIDEPHFKSVATKLMAEYFLHSVDTYMMRPFFSYCMDLSLFAGIALCFKVKNSPYVAIDTICKTLNKLKSKRQFHDYDWNDLDRFCSEK